MARKIVTMKEKIKILENIGEIYCHDAAEELKIHKALNDLGYLVEKQELTKRKYINKNYSKEEPEHGWQMEKYSLLIIYLEKEKEVEL